MPSITTSVATTRIRQPGSIIGYEPRKDPKPQPPKTHGVTLFRMVYVNEVGRASMLSTQPLVFPAGSIIVREKLLHATAPAPDMLAVMVKRNKGFNPKSNDWEFLVVSGNGKKIERREKGGTCLRCHAAKSQSDFVFREQVK